MTINSQENEKEYVSVREVDTDQDSELITYLKSLDSKPHEAKSFIEYDDKVREEVMRFLGEENNNLSMSNKTPVILDNTCANRRKDGTIADFYYFWPNYMGSSFKQGDSFSFESTCFKKNTFTLTKFTETEAHFELNAQESKGLFCVDYYLLSTSRIHETESVFRHGTHKIVLKKLIESDLNEIKLNGFKLLSFCQGIFESLHSLYDTLKLYLGGFSSKHPQVPERMVKSNVEFIQRYLGLELNKREDKILKYNKKDIKTGDFVAIFRLDGLDEMIMMGTGSSIGHTAVCAWMDDDLYVLESQDGWYWPFHGIQKNKFDDWVVLAHKADFNVAIIPLNEEARAKLNSDAALNWFKSVEGLNYGYHNFIYAWLDTQKNLPSYVDSETVLPLFSIFHSVTRKYFDLIMGEGLNQRIQTTNLSLPEVLSEAAKQGKTFEDLISMPEQQGWKYSDGENYVCSCFCTGFYKAGGLFDDLIINPQEFSPKDVYQLGFFDNSPERPDVCKEADPKSPFCNITGKYSIEFRGVGSISPYNNMNEKCDSQGPEYIRPENC